MAAAILSPFATIAAAMFVTELTDKDAILILGVSSRGRPVLTFLAGVTAFTLTTGLFVSIGSVLVLYVPVAWIRLAGGAMMLSYGAWEARGLVGAKVSEMEESRVEKRKSAAGFFLALVGALVFLDVAGDATEVLTVVLVARYAEPLLVFGAACAGLYAATAMEAALGSRLGRLLSPRRLRVLSAAVFFALGGFIFLTSL
ncbi:MAG: TMEM165/GDT1 family protein [Nitrososphaerota archaeon]|jgi:putative Ca2+/H+ antiporter (TMEM165/GDT1 family)|nr:TMEM165/GDT1 family protein [Nitrososphaerota archaeon]MDG6912612.1 TMEM165/GDT1 family protein [Nitrososphaerota archaeon]MDG6937123.1 TMEM165/GDT1 family protein [Nitrososphaerota archaeon]MDG6962446.1 TMEM165/GDT1 family protein [Nitrososphaerota archaeon]MDG6969834.1 TMEM165/GDT1 family protein [Nitrososphaerota archaeon]